MSSLSKDKSRYLRITTTCLLLKRPTILSSVLTDTLLFFVTWLSTVPVDETCYREPIDGHQHRQHLR